MSNWMPVLEDLLRIKKELQADRVTISLVDYDYATIQIGWNQTNVSQRISFAFLDSMIINVVDFIVQEVRDFILKSGQLPHKEKGTNERFNLG